MPNSKNIFGQEYSKYVNRLSAMAIANPEAYFKLREKVIDGVGKKLIDDISETYYKILTDGKIGNELIFDAAIGPPNYPKNKANKIAMNAAATSLNIFNSIISIILPSEITEISKLKVLNKSIAQTKSTETEA